MTYYQFLIEERIECLEGGYPYCEALLGREETVDELFEWWE